MKRLIPYTVAAMMMISTAASIADNSVRGLYVEQEKNPTAAKNTGLCYYLELKRGDEPVRRCTNKTVFHNGDKIRIKLKSNVDAYAYIVELQGSQGDKEVLFPGEDLGSNKIKAGNWMTLPRGGDGASAWMKFDKHPGTEVIRMMISRKKIDPDASTGGSSVVISSEGDDKVPDGTLVSISVAKGAKVSTNTRNLTVEQDAPADKQETTVVGKPDKVLAVDMALTHKKGASSDSED
jgi:hypothetical protein